MQSNFSHHCKTWQYHTCIPTWDWLCQFRATVHIYISCNAFQCTVALVSCDYQVICSRKSPHFLPWPANLPARHHKGCRKIHFYESGFFNLDTPHVFACDEDFSFSWLFGPNSHRHHFHDHPHHQLNDYRQQRRQLPVPSNDPLFSADATTAKGGRTTCVKVFCTTVLTIIGKIEPFFFFHWPIWNSGRFWPFWNTHPYIPLP